uniref:Uncharacterized protein n=1 Tax=Parascaris equorum TaxID=6256 RepID=A0A914S133_PAREQ
MVERNHRWKQNFSKYHPIKLSKYAYIILFFAKVSPAATVPIMR